MSAPAATPFGGLALAVAVIAAETISVVLLQHRAHGEAFAALYLIGVLLSAALSELAFAIATSLVSAATLLYFHSGPYELQDGLAAALFLVVALSTNFVADLARRHGRDAAQQRREAEQIAAMFKTSPKQLSVFARQQHALRRVATQVVRGARPSDVFLMVLDELARCLDADTAAMFRFDADGRVLLVGECSTEPTTTPGVAQRLVLEGDNIAAMVLRKGGPTPMDSHENAAGAVAACMRKLGLHSPFVAPIIVEDRAWGLLVAGSSRRQSILSSAESCVSDFADLVAGTISNAAAREELQASRDSLGVLATQQEALRRVATLVARGVSPEECFAAVAREMARCLNLEKAEVFRYEDDGAAIAVACHASPGTAYMPVGDRLAVRMTTLLRQYFAPAAPPEWTITARRGFGRRTPPRTWTWISGGCPDRGR